MKFRAALAVSSILHVSIFAYMLISPGRRDAGEMTYYVDLIHLSGPGGGGRGGGPAGGRSGTAGRSGGGAGEETGQTTMVSEAGRLRDLTARQDPPPSSLRYPDEQGRKQTEKKDAVSVIRKPQAEKTEVQSGGAGEGALTTGISTGTGSGSGGGGAGGGGPGGGWSFSHFPYAYYVETLRNRISVSWYNSLVEPGGRGRFLTSVYFRINRDGSITDLKVEKKSGLAALDLSALRAVESAAPFPPLPADFRSAYLGVFFEFEWER